MNSRDYWAQRETEQLKHNIRDEAAYDRELKRIYEAQLDAIQKEIDAFYGKYAGSEGITIAEAKKRVSKLDIEAYERKAKRYVKDKDFSQKANEEMRLYNATMRINRLEMLKANIGLELIAGTDELEKFMEGILQGRTEEELKRQAGILGKTVKNNAELANAIVNGSFHNAKFSDRIWMYQDLLKNDLGNLLQSGLIQGKSARALARDLKKTFNTSTYNAERLMRTELARVQTEAQRQSFKRNGFDMYMFIANVNPTKHNTCPICKALDGKHFKVDKMQPGENAPPMHPHCRCSTAAYFDTAEYEDWIEWLEQGGTSDEYNKLRAYEKELEEAENLKSSDVALEKSENGAIIQAGTEQRIADIIGIPKDKVNLDGLPEESKEVIYNGVRRVFERFPQLKGQLVDLHYDSTLTARANSSSITGIVRIGPEFANYEKLVKNYAYDVKLGIFPKGTTAESIVVHELGHQFDGLFTKNRIMGGTINTGGVIRSSKGVQKEVLARIGLTDERLREIRKEYAEKGYSGRDLTNAVFFERQEFISKHISDYANENEREFFAECFSEYMTSDSPREAARIFGEIFERELGGVKNDR